MCGFLKCSSLCKYIQNAAAEIKPSHYFLAVAFCTATYLLYIVSGSAEILVKWAQPPKKRSSQQQIQQGQQPASPQGGAADKGGDKGGDEFMDDTNETMSPIVDQVGGRLEDAWWALAVKD